MGNMICMYFDYLWSSKKVDISEFQSIKLSAQITKTAGTVSQSCMADEMDVDVRLLHFSCEGVHKLTMTLMDLFMLLSCQHPIFLLL